MVNIPRTMKSARQNCGEMNQQYSAGGPCRPEDEEQNQVREIYSYVWRGFIVCVCVCGGGVKFRLH
jgi:hypothetical protein